MIHRCQTWTLSPLYLNTNRVTMNNMGQEKQLDIHSTESTLFEKLAKHTFSTLVSLNFASVRHRTPHGIERTRTVGEPLPTVHGWQRWALGGRVATAHGAIHSNGNAEIRHWTSHGVCRTRTVDHSLSTVHGREDRARCWHSQGRGEEGEEQERHGLACSSEQFGFSPTCIYTPLPHVTFCSPHCCLCPWFYQAPVHIHSHTLYFCQIQKPFTRGMNYTKPYQLLLGVFALL